MKLVLCDDHALLLDALPPALERKGHAIAAVVATPEAAVDAVREHQPDVLLLDAMFPGDTGLRIVTTVLQASPSTKVVFLSGSSDPDLVAAAVEAGAVGFVRKDRGLDGILRALERVMAGEIVIDSALLRAVVGRRQAAEHDVRWLAQFLTEREKEVLDRLVAGQSTQEIARGMGIARSTARTHVQNVLQKLGVHSRLEAATAMFADSAGTRAPRRRL